MATLTVQNINRSGLEATYASAGAGGDEFTNNGSTFLHVKNGDGSAHTVTVASQYAPVPAGLAQSNVQVSVPAGEERMIGPFPTRAFNDEDGLTQVTYDAVTSVTIAVINIGA